MLRFVNTGQKIFKVLKQASYRPLETAVEITNKWSI